MSNRPFHRRLRDFEPIDEVRMRVVPRFKTSGLSGDEWRQSYKATLYFKHIELYEISRHSLKDIALTLLQVAMGHTEDGCLGGTSDAIHKILEAEAECCDQPYCVNAPVVFYRLKNTFSRSGEGPLPKTLDYYRQFCGTHRHRGDGSREDCDANYQEISDPRPEVGDE